MKIYYDSDSEPDLLKEKRIAIIGYGSQGHAQAQNLRDSGFDVIVSETENSPNWNLAVEHGFTPCSASKAAKLGEIIQLLVQDDIQKKLYEEAILPHLTPGKALVFSHGFNIHFRQIIPPHGIDVYMVAPKGPGHLVRRMYLEGEGVPSLIAVFKDATGSAKKLALAHACGIGAGRAGIIETTFKEETETDLFGEQAVLCGGITELIKAGFDTLVEAGYQPEIAYFECLHELKLIVDLIYEDGIQGMYYSVSDTAEYGGLTKGPRIITEEVRKTMKSVLREIQDGSFAKEWILENRSQRPVMHALQQQLGSLQIEQIGRNLREKMTWLQKKNKSV